MANLKKEYVIKEMKLKNKNILNMLPKAVTSYIKYKYQCSTYLAKQISKELTNDGTRTS
jgi:lipopolysaccharide biosynthesis glycosyltransferase